MLCCIEIYKNFARNHLTKTAFYGKIIRYKCVKTGKIMAPFSSTTKISEVNLSSLDTIPNSSKSAKVIKKAVNNLLEKLYAEDKKLANYQRLDNGISTFFQNLFNAPEWQYTFIDSEMNTLSQAAQQLKIVEMFATIFEKYDEATANKLLIKIADPNKPPEFMAGIIDNLNDWKNQSKGYDKTDVFAERIIEHSDKYNWNENKEE
ncbi:MAG: hypothetical protein LBU68_00760, partial [Rickettsiales bacterium]|nr:hypothetical protein [Rickettsiales bacterium]